MSPLVALGSRFRGSTVQFGWITPLMHQNRTPAEAEV